MGSQDPSSHNRNNWRTHWRLTIMTPKYELLLWKSSDYELMAVWLWRTGKLCSWNEHKQLEMGDHIKNGATKCQEFKIMNASGRPCSTIWQILPYFLFYQINGDGNLIYFYNSSQYFYLFHKRRGNISSFCFLHIVLIS